MLQKIRETATGWIAGIIVALLILSFALWGVGDYFSSGGEPFVAKVNDTEIKQTQFQRAFYNIRQQLQQQLGTQIDAEDPMVKRQAVSRLVDSELINQTIERSGLNISDRKVIETINQIDLFRNDAGFDQSVYERSMNALGMDPALYEYQVRLDMMSEQLQSAIAESSFSTESEIERLVRLKKQQRDFSYVQISTRKLSEGIEATDEEIKSYYDAHQGNYRQPQQVKIQYIDLTLDKVMEQVTVEADDVENYHSNNQVAYNDPEKRKVWQIKIGKPQEGAQGLDDVRAKAVELLEIAKGGDPFESIAENYSSSSNDKVKVDISESGLLAKGSLPKEVEEVVFQLEQDGLSDLIETDKAIFIVKLVEIQEARENGFDEVKDQVEKDLRRELAQKQFFDLADQLAALSYEQPDTLEVASDAIDIAVEESELFTQAGTDTGLLSYSRVVDTSFSEEVLLQGNNSDPLELNDERVVVLRVIEHIDEGQKSLDEVRETVASQVINEKARRQSEEIGEALLKAAESNELEPLLAEYGLELRTATEVNRDDISVSRSVLRTAFRMEKPADGERRVEGNQSGNGDYALVILEKVSYPEKIFDKDKNNESQAMRRVRAESDWDGYFEQIKETSDIQIVSDDL